MTQRQTGLYFREWGKARRALREAGLSPKEADAWRGRISEDVCGKPTSSKKLNNTQLDKVLACFRGLADSSDDAFQLRQLEQPLIRMKWVVANAAASIGKTEQYAEGIAFRMFNHGFDLCDERKFRSVLGALNKYKARHAKKASPKPEPEVEPDNCPF